MCTRAPDDEDVIAAPHDEHPFARYVAGEHAGARKIRKEDAFREIGSRQLLFAAHRESLSR
jgi:hypothetical protein